MPTRKYPLNTARLIRIKQAQIKMKESELNYQIKQGASDKTRVRLQKDIRKLEREITSLKK